MGGLADLAERLRQAEGITKDEWRRLSDPAAGPFQHARRMAGSGEAWKGAAAERLCDLLITLDRQYLGPLCEELGLLGCRLEKLADEVDYVLQLEANGACAPQDVDVDGSLARLRQCEFRRTPPPGWCDALLGAPGGHFSIDPPRTRDLARLIRCGAEELRGAFDRLRGPLVELGLEPFAELRLIAASTEDLAAAVIGRVEAYEEADRRAASGYAGLLSPIDFVTAVPPSGRPLSRGPAGGPAVGVRDPSRRLPAAPPERLAEARNTSPKQRFDILKQFFRKFGGEKGGLGYGKGLEVFMNWEMKSGRLDRQFGSAWWRAVNGSMMLDIREAYDLVEARGSKARSANPAVQAWISFARGKKHRQESLWKAHQLSLHAGIRGAQQSGLFDQMAPNEQAFVGQVVENVDLSAISGFPTRGAGARMGMAEYLDRVYPDGSVANEADLRRVEGWAMPGSMIDPRGLIYLRAGGVIGLESTKW